LKCLVRKEDKNAEMFIVLKQGTILIRTSDTQIKVEFKGTARENPKKMEISFKDKAEVPCTWNEWI